MTRWTARRAAGWTAAGLLVALLVTLVAPWSAMAQPQATESPEDAWEIVLAGVVVARIRFGLGGLTPLERQHLVYQRLREAIESYDESLSPDLVHVTESGGQVFVNLGSYVILTADEAHARYHQSIPRGLAEVWAANLRRAVERYVHINFGE
ncbi:MAG: hypothetical protein H0Z37_10970 [Firmicutes bacterium]|nr:hypothetical protein [Bacillota bacterium]